ncbi:Homeodomain leucine zipper family IV protein [Zea mays]|uniref:Homeodomain leucine zipper family IV protein n=2 Tax=Zea mays TaxID=4577 RepID=A0A1D6EEJ9_MAIZE|nr:Homeodomain leucine zipper family IV protein [Zea mays]ONM18638.1 Homeodomain leucine zipper family IV protein [Zea mays]ONM18639.1 Homeodomain leucine zipper family IV protein [Zea mays]ONM18641.1 Homeodomain leucine zipper family IV protein [Zea mays]ONM18642.1 Homeodomain leucine zipper family IV protein [Zea mays]
MVHEGQLKNTEPDIGVNMGDDELIYLPDIEEYDMDALMGDEDQLNTDQAIFCEEHNLDKVSSSKRPKRFTVQQLQQLESSFQKCSHPDDEMRQELAAKVGISARQVKFWFQNRRSQIKVRSCGTENNKYRRQNAELLATNMELKEQLKGMTCSRCDAPTIMQKWQLMDENAKLREMYSLASAELTKLMQEANLPPSVILEDMALVTSMNPLSSNASSSRSTINQDELLSYVECAIKEFEMLVRDGTPLWLPTIGGDVLNSKEYACQRFPRLHGTIRPEGFVVEATRDTAIVKGSAPDIVDILTDVPRWYKAFPCIVAALRAYHVIFSGPFASGNVLIQEINVDLSVESPRPPLRNMKFLRITKQNANGDFVVVDVSINDVQGIHEQQGSQHKHTMLPSGCLIKDKGDGYCQVTWIVHAEYEEASVPPLFRQFYQSGLAFGASRWLASLQRHCEYMVVKHSIQVPTGCVSGSGVLTLSALGRWNLLELAQRMMAIFYKTTSGLPTVEPGNIVTRWGRGCMGTTGEMLEPAVRMVLGNYFGAMDGQPSPLQVLSATTTVWLPGTPPESVFNYLCNGQRRGEWDAFVCAGAVQELSSVATCPHLHGNAVSVLCPNVTNAANNAMLFLQQTSIDVSRALVVYSVVEETMLRSVLDVSDDTSNLVLLPSGFAILPDGHGRAHHAAASNSSSALAGLNGTAGCLLTAAYQVPVPFNNLRHPDVQETYENAGKRICHAIKKIMDAVGAPIVVPI